MNYKVKSKLDVVNKILAVILAIVFVALVLVVSFYKGEPTEEEAPVESAIAEFEPGTYGGVEFKTVEDVANYYKEAYDYTKTLTANYSVDGQDKALYKLLGSDNLEVKNIMIGGKANGAVDTAVGGVVSSMYKPSVLGLLPTGGSSIETDKSSDGSLVYNQLLFTAEDIAACNVKDNGDGTITLQIQPKAVDNSKELQDSQGKFFKVLGDIPGIVDSLGIVKFTQGDVMDNIVVHYDGGYGTIVIDTATKEVVKADYIETIHLSITHANAFGIIKDKSADLDLIETTVYPADPEVLADNNVVLK